MCVCLYKTQVWKRACKNLAISSRCARVARDSLTHESHMQCNQGLRIFTGILALITAGYKEWRPTRDNQTIRATKDDVYANLNIT